MGALFWILAIACFAYVITNLILNETAQEETVRAKLVKKDIDTVIDSNNMINTSYILTFDIDGKNKRLVCAYKNYEQYEENQIGTLTYKRNKFVNFVVEK